MFVVALDEKAARPTPLGLLSKINGWAREKARSLAAKKLVQPKQACTFTLKEMRPLILSLWRESSVLSKKTALAAALCFLSGCRMKEALGLYIEDFRKVVNHQGLAFLICPLRVSKTNVFCTKREELIIPLPKDLVFPLLDMCREISNKRVAGLLFAGNPILTTAKTSYHLGRVAKQLSFKNIPTGHSGRVSMLVRMLQEGISETNVKVHMRWKSDSSMIQYYRSNNLETHASAAPAQLLEKNFFSF